jgi:hypothetical protein
MDTKQSPGETSAQTTTGPNIESVAREKFRSQHAVKLVEKAQAGESAVALPFHQWILMF